METEEEEENRCLINGCQEEIACSVCGGCERHHIINLENGNCDIEKLMEEVEDRDELKEIVTEKLNNINKKIKE